ncbi:hypothetical protein SAMN05720764_103113 [Fibrobacter sp. UWH5]|uniref:hypothetical protein n=1 Tax=Fibrobacter sp. UWH5 TaxID=1896211 RepID=UPI00091BFC74|nr:hypothetical protein [Fibrobacter sp. UWH5]SHK71583.1 hypothetical protein SAMN05720764_103113 [Fibrobacter sp. UWH5]
MALIRKILTFLAFMAAVVLAAPSMPATSVEKTQKVLQAKSKTSKSAKKAKKSKKKKKKKEQAEQVVETAEEESAAESSTEAVEDNAEEQTAEAEVPQEEQSDLESAFEEVQSSAAPEQAPTPPAESALQPVAEPTPQPEAKPAAQPAPQPAAQPATQASAQPAAKATTVNPAVLNTKPGQQTFILRGTPTQATTAAVADTANKVEDETLTEKKTYANRFKAMRKKKSVAEYDSTQNAIRDSIASITYNFGLSFIGGRAKDKRLGNLEENSDWDGNFGVYLFYRYYFTSFFALQGRLGAIYRYARFTKNDEIKDGITYKETQFDVNNKLTVDYHDIAVDAPLTLKFGAHTGHTTFIFLSLAGDITKSIFDQINTTREYTVKHPSKELKKDLAVLESKGLYPAYENYTVEGNFYVDDWEFSSWAGAGIDCKYISVEYQVLLAAGSTKDNHRFHAINHGGMPSWRVMVDLSLK